MPLGKDEILKRFGSHPPKSPVEAHRHDQVRQAFIDFSEFLDLILPDGRAKSTAMTKLQEAAFWSNFGIAELSPVVQPPRNPPKVSEVVVNDATVIRGGVI